MGHYASSYHVGKPTTYEDGTPHNSIFDDYTDAQFA